MSPAPERGNSMGSSISLLDGRHEEDRHIDPPEYLLGHTSHKAVLSDPLGVRPKDDHIRFTGSVDAHLR